MNVEPTIRPADFHDADAIATIQWSSRKQAMPWLRRVHSALEIRHYVARVLLREQSVFVAELRGKVIGYLAFKGTELNHLYVSPTHQRRGVGTVLLNFAKKRMPRGFTLWAFARNTPAREFYRKHGLADLRETDGASNEEREPDVQMEWKPTVA
ncbi:MAG: GNAT family N-acetyltransferase [Tepidisphaeraceae bacterium]